MTIRKVQKRRQLFGIVVLVSFLTKQTVLLMDPVEALEPSAKVAKQHPPPENERSMRAGGPHKDEGNQ
jgi:hypothetical protein